jgi:orotidine-5'-phosphate decarboxylase
VADRLIVALDTAEQRRAIELVELLLPEVKRFKVGLELFTACGPSLVRDLASAGAGIFLDLKLHDIPNTVSHAVAAARDLPGVFMMTLHTAGGRRMLAAAAETVQGARLDPGALAPPGLRRPALLGITVLTSLSDADLDEAGVAGTAAEQVARLARLARAAGLDGVVCSPREVRALRHELGKEFILVTPGVRPAGADAGDQARTGTPEEAVRDGATYLVVGRPITQDRSPLDAARRIIASLP